MDIQPVVMCEEHGLTSKPCHPPHSILPQVPNLREDSASATVKYPHFSLDIPDPLDTIGQLVI